MRKKLPEEDIAARLQAYADWRYDDGKLVRELKFDSFAGAFGFMTQVALYAEKMDHHPDWRNVYNRVTVELSTHDAQGVTELDFKLATRIDELA